MSGQANRGGAREDGSGVALVVIDDEEDVRDVVVRLLRRAGYRVEGAADGPSGIDAVLSHRPDLVICDITMPGMTGYEVLLNLRANYPAVSATPFVFMSALSDLSDIAAGRLLGADDYVTKPINFDLLLVTIETVLDRAGRGVQAPVAVVGWEGAAGVAARAFRDPLNGIAGCAEVLGLGMAGPLRNAEQVRLIDEIQRATRDLIGLVDDMSALTRIARGRLVLSRRPVPFGAILAEIARAARVRPRKPHVQIIEDLAADLPLVSADEHLFARALGDVVDGAIRLADRSGTVSLAASRPSPGAAAIIVTATGAPPEDGFLSRVNAPFDPQAADDDDLGPGGVGLTLARAVLGLHGFALKVEAVDGGVAFHVTLPTDGAAA